MKIQELSARSIKNSRGEKTIEILVNKKYKASAPSGASRGSHEIAAFPQKGLDFSVQFINRHPHFRGLILNEFSDLALFDSFIPILGGNAIVAMQTACLRAMSSGEIAPFLSSRLKFPIPLGNCVGGGAHTSLVSTDIQEFLLIPKGKTFQERVILNRCVYEMIKKCSTTRKKTDEGAWILQKSDEEVFIFLSELLRDLKAYGLHIELGVDIAASQLYKKGKYYYKNYSSSTKKKIFSPSQQIDLVNKWIKKYHLSYVEDPLYEEDFPGFSRIAKKTLVCGDDLITTNIQRLKLALKQKSVNTIIVKPNQIGSLVKTKEIIDFCKKKEIKTVISHRSGETMDILIAELATGWHIPYMKTGIFGKEREVKLAEVIKLEEEYS